MSEVTKTALQRIKMTKVDAAWLHMEQSTNLMMICGVMMFDTPIDWERLRQVVHDKLLKPYPRFNMRVDSTHKSFRSTFWEHDPTFNPDDHMEIVQLPAPGDKLALERFTSDVIGMPLDFSKPLWHFYFVEGYGDGCAVVARLHHAIADGIALARVLISLTDPAPDGMEVDQGLSIKKQNVPSSLSELEEEDEDDNFFDRVRDIARIGGDSVKAFNKLMFSSADNPTLFRGELGVVKRVSWSKPIDLATVKSTGRAFGGTINDTLLTAVTGGLRRYLLKHDSLVDQIRTTVPVNLRPLEGEIKLGNRFGLVFLTLPVGIETSRERMRLLKADMDAIKASPEAIVAFGLLGILGVTPPVAERRIMQMFASKVSAVMTNVPGPRAPIYLAGTELRELMFWVPQSGGLGMGVSLISYNGRVQVGITTDVGLVPDPDRLVAYFEDEMIALQEEAIAIRDEEVAAQTTTSDQSAQS